MDRLPPFDKIGVTPVPDFQNADPETSNEGSIVNALIFNQLQREGVNLELLAGLVPDSANLFQWAQAISRGGIWCGPLTGTGDLVVATLGAPLPAILQGMRIAAVATVTKALLPALNVGPQGAQGPPGIGTTPRAYPLAVAASGQVAFPLSVPPLSPADVILFVNGAAYRTPAITLTAVLLTWAGGFPPPPVPPSEVLFTTLTGMLGIAGLRSYDKLKGTAAPTIAPKK